MTIRYLGIIGDQDAPNLTIRPQHRPGAGTGTQRAATDPLLLALGSGHVQAEGTRTRRAKASALLAGGTIRIDQAATDADVVRGP